MPKHFLDTYSMPLPDIRLPYSHQLPRFSSQAVLSRFRIYQSQGVPSIYCKGILSASFFACTIGCFG